MSSLWRSRREMPLPHKTEDCRKKRCESTPRVAHCTHPTHMGGTRNTAVQQSLDHIYMNMKDAPKNLLALSTTLGCSRKLHCTSSRVVVPVAGYMYQYHTSAKTSSSTDRSYRSQGPIKKQLLIIIGSHSNTAGTNYRTRVMLLPALLAGGWRIWR